MHALVFNGVSGLFPFDAYCKEVVFGKPDEDWLPQGVKEKEEVLEEC